jgi:hypothetical protein
MVKKGKKTNSKKEESEEVKLASKKEQIKNENKILRNLLIGIGVFILAILFFVFVLGSIRHFEYEGLEFEVVKFCDAKPCLITYQTALKVMFEGNVIPYNFYLRNDPRDLGEEVNFEGELVLLENMVIESEEGFNCDGDGIIAMKNLVTLYDVVGINVMKDETASCPEDETYMFVRVQLGDETSIEQFGPSCYNININNCEILEGTERFMIETFVEL